MYAQGVLDNDCRLSEGCFHVFKTGRNLDGLLGKMYLERKFRDLVIKCTKYYCYVCADHSFVLELTLLNFQINNWNTTRRSAIWYVWFSSSDCVKTFAFLRSYPEISKWIKTNTDYVHYGLEECRRVSDDSGGNSHNVLNVFKSGNGIGLMVLYLNNNGSLCFLNGF